MDKFSLLLSVVAVGLAGFLMLDGRENSAAPAADGGADSALLERLDRIEGELARLQATDGRMLQGAGRSGNGEAGATAPRLSGTPGAGTHAGTAPAPDRLERLEQELAATKERLAKVEDPSTRVAAPAGTFFSPMGGRGRFLHSADAAAKALKLDERQQQDLEQVVESTKGRLEDLYATPNDDGLTLAEISKLDMKFDQESGEAPGLDMGKLMAHMQRVEKFKKSNVPGSNETYRQADKRIRTQGKDEARGLLNEEQAKQWDQSQTDALFRSPGSGSAVITSTSISSGPISISGGK